MLSSRSAPVLCRAVAGRGLSELRGQLIDGGKARIRWAAPPRSRWLRAVAEQEGPRGPTDTRMAALRPSGPGNQEASGGTRSAP